MDTVETYFRNLGHFFRFSKSAGEAYPLTPSYTSVSVTEYASISLNMPKHS